MNEEQEKEQIFLELQAEIKANLEEYKKGNYITLEELAEQLKSPSNQRL